MTKRLLAKLLAIALIVFLLWSVTAQARAVETLPELPGIELWLNSKPLTGDDLKGKVVLVDFWTYTCINCLRTFPHLKSWYEKYKIYGLEIIGVHSPEFDFEKNPENVKKAIQNHGLPYPIALDNKMATWTLFNNQYWPAHYLFDADGKLRDTHFGEGNYEKTEAMIRRLLIEKSKNPNLFLEPAKTLPTGVDFSEIHTPETYLGFERARHYVTAKTKLELNDWTYEGQWKQDPDRILLEKGMGKIVIRFKATQVNLVLRPGDRQNNRPIQAVIKLDGRRVQPALSGKDVHNSILNITESRLYELISIGKKAEEHFLEIEFLAPGASAYAFTFG